MSKFYDFLIAVFAVATVVALVVIVYFLGNRNPSTSTITCMTQNGVFKTPAAHWRYESGTYTNGKYRVFVVSPALCKVEVVK